MPPPAKIAMSTAGDSSDWMIDVASGAVLDAAFNWLCKRRVDYADNADVWNVRFRWTEIKLQLQQDLLEGQYRFSPLRRVQAHGECIELWNALDALVLKALAIVLNRRLDFPRNCFHVPGMLHDSSCILKANRIAFPQFCPRKTRISAGPSPAFGHPRQNMFNATENAEVRAPATVEIRRRAW